MTGFFAGLGVGVVLGAGLYHVIGMVFGYDWLSVAVGKIKSLFTRQP